MKQKPLGRSQLVISEMGLGCMGMSEFYGETDDKESLKVLDRALELGINFWDTADIYGPHRNEELVGRAMQGRRDRVVLATKFGIVRDPSNPNTRGVNGRPEYVRSSCEASLRRLNTDFIDLYYQHRVDPETPIEETVGAMAKLVEEGKVRTIGLSEASASTIRRAHKIFPISAVQTEYSLWSRDPEDEILPTCRELGISFVAYSPLGRGFLTGQIKRYEDFAEDDFRRRQPRFMGDNFAKNLELVEKIGELARQRNCKPSQLALAWVMAQSDDIIPIPGTKQLKYLEENAAAADLDLTENELRTLDEIAPPGVAAGTRYTEAGMKGVNR